MDFTSVLLIMALQTNISLARGFLLLQASIRHLLASPAPAGGFLTVSLNLKQSRQHLTFL